MGERRRFAAARVCFGEMLALLLPVLFPAGSSARSEQSQAGYVEGAGQKISS